MRRKKFEIWKERLRREHTRAIEEALELSGGLLPEAAELLGVSSRTLRRWLEKMDLGHLSTYRSGGEHAKRSRIKEAKKGARA